MTREAILQSLANHILQIRPPHPLKVAIDGVDASGKTRLADELAEILKHKSREVIRASVDGFHNPKTIRRRKGELSPEGFYHDSYNYPALIQNLLLPLSPGGDRRYRTAVFDILNNQSVDTTPQTAAADAILLMDGIFLLRPKLIQYWDLKIFLQVEFSNSVRRGIARDTGVIGSAEVVTSRYGNRYVPGQRLYLREAKPQQAADIVIDNTRLDAPEIIKFPETFISNPHLNQPKD